MKALGIVRKIDELGRVVVPKEVRDHFGWVAGTPLEMLSTEKGVLLRPYKPLDEEKIIIVNHLKDVYEVSKNETVKEIIGNAIDFLNRQ